MNLDDLKDQVVTRLNELRERIAEHPTYNTLREKFLTLPVQQQRLVLGGLAAAGLLLVLYLPLSYLNSSSDAISEFEENRQLIRKLLAVSSESKSLEDLPPPLTSSQLQDVVRSNLGNFRLLPDQVGPIEALTGPGSAYAPSSVHQEGVSVQLFKLNLDQLVLIGHGLQNIGSSGAVKLMGLKVNASQGLSHYYDVVFELVSFGLPTVESEEEEEPQPKMKMPRPRKAAPDGE